MASTFYLEIVTPERKFFEDDVEMIILKTQEGEIGVLPEHMPLVVAVVAGPVKIKIDGEWKEAVLTEGFMEILPHKTVVLTDTAEWPEEIDANRALEAKHRAEERLTRKVSYQQYIQSRAALSRAMARLKVKNEGMNR